MKVTIHKLFDYLLETTAQDPPECFIGFSLARSPRLIQHPLPQAG